MNILSMSGFVPEQICDTERFTGCPGKQRISHFCGYAADFISQVLHDPEIDGAAFPRTCDSCRTIPSYLADCGKFVFQIAVPSRQDALALRFLTSEIKRYRQEVEAHYGVMLSDIEERAERINARNAQLMQMYGQLADISYGAWLRALHQLLHTPLREQAAPAQLPGKPGAGKRVFLIGSLLTNEALASQIESTGMSVVGDRLTESRRLFFAPPVRASGDICESIAESMLRNPASPTQSCFDAILREDREELQRKRAEGVIYITQKFCEPYDYLFPAYRRMLDALGLPVLRLSLTDSTDGNRFEAMLEAFADTL